MKKINFLHCSAAAKYDMVNTKHKLTCKEVTTKNTPQYNH